MRGHMMLSHIPWPAVRDGISPAMLHQCAISPSVTVCNCAHLRAGAHTLLEIYCIFTGNSWLIIAVNLQ